MDVHKILRRRFVLVSRVAKSILQRILAVV